VDDRRDGMACGAGLALLAIVVTALHFVVVLGFTAITARLPRGSGLRIVYTDGQGILRELLTEATGRGFSIAGVATSHHDVGGMAAVAVTLEVQGRGSVQDLALALDEHDGVLEVAATQAD
jgi:putative Mg2+ transporter-C (MgtC) family protein